MESFPNIATPLSLTLKLSYGVGHVLNDLCASMWFTYLLVYFHLVLNYSNSLAGVVLLIGQIADGLSTLFVGFESDKMDSFWLCKYGRRKTWHLLGTVCVLVSFPFLFMKCINCSHADQWAQMIYYAAFVIIFQFGWASVQISHLSLIPDLTLDPHERTELNAIRYGFTVIANICVYGLTWIIIGGVGDAQYSEADKVGPEDADKFKHIALIVVGIGAVFSFIFHLGVKEWNYDDSFGSSYPSISQGRHSDRLLMCWKDWLKEVQFYQVAVLYMATRLFVNLSQVYIPLYLQDTLGLHESSIAIIPLVMFVSGFLSSFFMKFLNRVAGRKITFLLGALVGLGACVWLYFGKNDSYRFRELYVVASFLGIGGSTMLITSLSITNDLIGDNNETGAFVFGIMSLCDKFSNGITVLFIQYFHPCKTCCVECAFYYRYVLACGCGGACLLALVVLATLIPVTIGERQKKNSALSGNMTEEFPSMVKCPINNEKSPLLQSMESH